MRDLIIDMADFGGVASAGDEVVLSAPAVRGSSVDPGRLITPQPRALELVDGVVTVPVEVGPLRVTLKPQGGVLPGTTFKTVVPEGEGPITLRLCLEGQFRYDPPVVSAVGEAAVRAEQAASAAAVSAGAAGGAAVVAEGHADRAEVAESGARSAAGAAASATTALIRDEMDAKVAVADGFAQSAEQDAGQTADDRQAVADDRVFVAGARSDISEMSAATITAAGIVKDLWEEGVPGGVVPHIGPNGNWWVGETDTGTPAQGPPGTGGGGGVSLVEDPPGSGLFLIGA